MNNQTNIKLKAYVIRYGDLPAQINRAVYQRPLFLSKNADLEYITSKGSKICDAIRNNVKVSEIPFTWIRRFGIIGTSIWSAFASIFITLKLWNQKDILVYVFHRQGFTAGGLLKLLRGSKIRLVCDMQHTPFYYRDASKSVNLSIFKRIVYRIIGELHVNIAKIILPKADLVYAMSMEYGEGFANIMEKDFNVQLERLFPIPNGADTSLAEKNIAEIVYQATNPNITRLIYAGNMQAERLKFIMEVYKAYTKHDKNVELLLCGNITSEAMDLLKKESVHGVNYLGVLDHSDLLKIYQTVDVVLVTIETSRRDHKFSHPGKLFEAMAMQKIVLASDFNLAKHLIKHGCNGFIVTPNTLNLVCLDLYNTLNKPELRTSIEKAARKTAEPFGWSKLNYRWFQRIQTVFV